jgi:hypothetical protein
MNENEKKEGIFLTVEQAFENALANLKGKTHEKERGKIYVWRQRFKNGDLSHKKVAAILENAGMHKVVEERWITIDPNTLKEFQTPEAFPE